MAETIYDYDEVQEIAEETMVGDLVQTCLTELKAAPDVWQKLSEDKQADVLERLEKRVKAAIKRAVFIIASEDRPTIDAIIEQITVKDGYKAVLKISRSAPGALDLVESQSGGDSEVLIVLPNAGKYRDQGAGVKPDPDQPGLGFEDDREGETGNVVEFNGEDPLLQNAISHVVESRKCSISSVQRAIKIGYNRAARMVERMEELGIVSPMNENGTRDILTDRKPTAQETEEALAEAIEESQEGVEPAAAENQDERTLVTPEDDEEVAADLWHPLLGGAIDILDGNVIIDAAALAEELEASLGDGEILIEQLQRRGLIGPPDKKTGACEVFLDPDE